MNHTSKEVWLTEDANSRWWWPVYVFLLFSFSANAQDYVLPPQTVPAGEVVTYTAINAIYSLSGTPFIVESGGQATFKAGKRIELGTGFKVLNGGRLSASIESVDAIPVEEPVKNIFTVFPNPTDGHLTVTSPQSIDAVRLMDMNGFTAMEQTDINNTDFSMDISPVKSGLYILEITSGNVVEKVRIEKN